MSNRSSLAFATLIPASMLLASCSPPSIDIEIIERSSGFWVGLEQDWGIVFSDVKAPCIDRIEVIEGEDSIAPLWSVEFKSENGGGCKDLASFKIGEAPSGFEEIVALEAELADTMQLVIWGIGIGKAPIPAPQI